jgi:hypothetical protein
MCLFAVVGFVGIDKVANDDAQNGGNNNKNHGVAPAVRRGRSGV